MEPNLNQPPNVPPTGPTTTPRAAPVMPTRPQVVLERPHTEIGTNRKHPLMVLRDIALAVAIPSLFIIAFGLFQTMFPQKIVSSETPAKYGLAFEDVQLTTADGLRLAAWYVPAKQGDGRTAVVVLHGYPADKGDLIGRASFLAERHALLLVDFRYFGASEGKFTTVGLREVEDALAAVEYLRTRGAERIGIYGFSVGGAVALMTTDRTTDVDAIVAEAAYATLGDIAEEPYKFLGPLKGPLGALTAWSAGIIVGLDPEEVSPIHAVSGSRVPTLLIHSRADETIPFRNAERLWVAMGANAEAERLFMDDLPHGAASPEFAKTVDDFLQAHLIRSDL